MKFLVLAGLLFLSSAVFAEVDKLGPVQEQMVRRSEGVLKASQSLRRQLREKMELVEILGARGVLLDLTRKTMNATAGLDSSEVYLHLYFRSEDGSLECLVRRRLYNVVSVGNFARRAICRDHGNLLEVPLP